GLTPRAQAQIYRQVGCKRCNYTGYRGRMAIIELLRIDNDIDALVARRSPLDEIRKTALEKGFVTLADDGIRRILEGYTSLAEVTRVIDLTSSVRH
ncbi:MAG: secretion system protein E, partial [Methylophilaceae bacterium]|nr:secretion system protein E [Methylophilaceae bacterium]